MKSNDCQNCVGNTEDLVPKINNPFGVLPSAVLWMWQQSSVLGELLAKRLSCQGKDVSPGSWDKLLLLCLGKPSLSSPWGCQWGQTAGGAHPVTGWSKEKGWISYFLKLVGRWCGGLWAQEGSKSFLVFCCCLIGRVFLQHAVLVNQKKPKNLFNREPWIGYNEPLFENSLYVVIFS